MTVEVSQEQSVRRDRWAGLGLIPSLAAGGLAVLYATGALLESAQLRGANLDIRDALPLIPLQQMLAVGIGTVVTSLVIIAVWAGLVVGYLRMTPEHPREPAWQFRSARTAAVARRSFWPIVIVAVGSNLWTYSLVSALIVTSGLVFGIFAANAEMHGRRWLVKIMFIYFFVNISLGIINAFVTPKPLPAASISLRNGTTAVGFLISRDASTWFVATGPKTFVAFPADRIEVVRVHSRKPSKGPTPPLKWLWHLIT